MYSRFFVKPVISNITRNIRSISKETVENAKEAAVAASMVAAVSYLGVVGMTVFARSLFWTARKTDDAIDYGIDKIKNVGNSFRG